jgi:uncharacterized protein
MRILVSGSSGLVGSALVPVLTMAEHKVSRLVRPGGFPSHTDVVWDPAQERINPASLEGFDAVVHLAGENIARARWTPMQKERIRDSRVKSTRLLVESLTGLASPPRVLVAASAAGFYGDRGDEVLTEESPGGTGFLPEVCRQWEAATEPAARRGIRVVTLRFGMVLSSDGGALEVMLPLFKLGLGGPLGRGSQWVGWIAIDDVLAVIQHAIGSEVSGPVNTVAPQPVTNREFTQTLAGVIHRPALLTAPAFALRLILGDIADEVLLASARVSPVRLQASGYRFLYPELERALRYLLGPGRR